MRRLVHNSRVTHPDFNLTKPGLTSAAPGERIGKNGKLNSKVNREGFDWPMLLENQENKKRYWYNS